MPTMRGQKFWKKTNKETLQLPPMRKMLGRPKRIRRKQLIELVRGNRMTKEGKRMACSTCHVVGQKLQGLSCKKRISSTN